MTKSQFKELVVYISKQCSNDNNFGVTKLNKILFFADFGFYLQTGRSLTGKKYVHDQFGPVPVGIEHVRGSMEKVDIAVAHMQAGPYLRKNIVALRDADISKIEPEKIAWLQKVIDYYCSPSRSKTATWMSDLSHDFIGYDVTERGEEIPYQTIYLQNKSKQVLTEGNILLGKELAKRYASTAA